MQDLLIRIWYHGHWAGAALIPLGWVFRTIAVLRRAAYRNGVLRSVRLPIPVLVVGNIVVGGAGKTPLVIWLASYLSDRGLSPGVLSRGYLARDSAAGRLVEADSDAAEVGDEPVLIARRCPVPVMVDGDRVRGARRLLKDHGCDVIICDDGLQHYRLQRDIEIAVVDGARRHGNGRCLPAGPLREPLSRLRSVDLVVVNGAGKAGELCMELVPDAVVSLASGERRQLRDFAGCPVHAVCGIGNPERFFAMLRGAGLHVHPHAFPDHHPFRVEDLAHAPAYPVLMTEKDAVKCASVAGPDCWFVRVSAEVPEALHEVLVETIHGHVPGPARAAAGPGGDP